jgi:signal transduction histidine kinase
MESPTIRGRESDFYPFLHRTTAHLRSAREVDAVLRHAVRAAVAFFGADAGCVAAFDAVDGAAGVVFSHPQDAAWDHEFFAELIANRRPPFPQGLICATVARRGRGWGVIALRRRDARFERWQERSLHPLALEISDLVERIDRERLVEVRARIDGKIMRELAPKDLYYQILDGLHQLTRYDHSAALYILDPAGAAFELKAEQIAWRKLKSDRIGAVVDLTEDLAKLVGGSTVYGFDRDGVGWREWTRRGAVALAQALEPDGAATGAATDAPPVRAMLCAPLGTQRGAVGLLRLAALRAGAFEDYERDILARFAPVVSLVLQRSQALESLQHRMLVVERRNTLGHLARGVSHDINNALGAVAPLVQQMRGEIEEGTADLDAFAADLQQIESSIETCRRIFAGMLRTARGTSRHDGTCDLCRAIENTTGLLRESLGRQGIQLVLEVPKDLPVVRGRQEDVERVLLNLATNAWEAMPRGGTLAIRVEASDDAVRVRIEDTGRGIPPDLIRQIDKPFFSTKHEGWGLGLPTCRSILSEIGGELTIESAPERGTRVAIALRPSVVRELAS